MEIVVIVICIFAFAIKYDMCYTADIHKNKTKFNWVEMNFIKHGNFLSIVN